MTANVLAKKIEDTIVIYADERYEYCSKHRMYYYDGMFQCEECYREISIYDVDVEDIIVDVEAICNFILKQDKPKTYLTAWYIYCNGEEDDAIYNKKYVEQLYNQIKNLKHLDEKTKLHLNNILTPNFEKLIKIKKQNNIMATRYEQFLNEWSFQWFQFIKDNPNEDWDYEELSSNPNVTWKIVKNNPDIPWDYMWLSINPNITWEIVRANPDKPWDYEKLSMNPNITWKIVQANPHKPWNHKYLSSNPNITWEIVQANPDKPMKHMLYFAYEIHKHKPDDWFISWQPDDEIIHLKHWNYLHMSTNPNITWEIVQANPDKPWNYSLLSENPSITWEIVQENPDKHWNYWKLSRNPNITWEIVRKNHNKPWNYSLLSENPNITWEIVQANPHENWDYYLLSENPNITWEIIQANPDKHWDYDLLSSNSNITWEIVQANPDKPWNYTGFSLNPMTRARENFIRKKFQEWFKRSALKEELIAKLWHPSNYKKFKYYDPEMFCDEDEDN